MSRLNSREIRLILDALSAKYGLGYSDVPEVGALQVKLSIMLQVTAANEK